MAQETRVQFTQKDDELVVQALAAILRANGEKAQQLRDFVDAGEQESPTSGIQFQPKPGHILVCHFGLGFRKPEMVKTRPVLVISPKTSPWNRLSIVLPISSTPPSPITAHHFKLPPGILPSGAYQEAWIKGDMICAVGAHRLDRLKVGYRTYAAPLVSQETLREARRCVLNAIGMHALTKHL